MPIALIPPFSHRREKGGDSRLSSCSWASGEKWVSGLLRRSVLSPYRPRGVQCGHAAANPIAMSECLHVRRGHLSAHPPSDA